MLRKLLLTLTVVAIPGSGGRRRALLSTVKTGYDGEKEWFIRQGKVPCETPPPHDTPKIALDKVRLRKVGSSKLYLTCIKTALPGCFHGKACRGKLTNTKHALQHPCASARRSEAQRRSYSGEYGRKAFAHFGNEPPGWALDNQAGPLAAISTD